MLETTHLGHYNISRNVIETVLRQTYIKGAFWEGKESVKF